MKRGWRCRAFVIQAHHGKTSSLTSTISIGAYNAAVDCHTTGHNLADVAMPGNSRQQIDFVSAFSSSEREMLIGRGVDARFGVSRIVRCTYHEHSNGERGAHPDKDPYRGAALPDQRRGRLESLFGFCATSRRSRRSSSPQHKCFSPGSSTFSSRRIPC